VLFAPTQGRGRALASTSRPLVMVVIPAQSSAGVTVVMPSPSNAGREEVVVAPRVPGRRWTWFLRMVPAGGG
jgi:hypothetical protein